MPVSRRTFLKTAAIASGATVMPLGDAVWADWPSESVLDELRAKVGERLIAVENPLAPCLVGASGEACEARLQNLNNPFFIERQPGGYQSTGWLDAWKVEISPYAVAAESPGDIVAAVNFAREHGVRLAIKGTGHDYLGRNCAAASLLVWTHNMRAVNYHEAFRIAGADDTAPGVPAVSAQAGARWVEVYLAASANDRYVQGGGCTSVGAAGGFIQGGGYGSFSKRFGSGAGGVLEFEVVTADGQMLVANAIQNSDLFWALRGGGGGTFGVVTKVMLRTHERPDTFGILSGTITAPDDEGFKDLIEWIVAFYPDALNNPSWGEQISLKPDNSLELFMTYLDLDEATAMSVWAPLADALPEGFAVDLSAKTHPFAGMWDLDYWRDTDPGFVTTDQSPGGDPNMFWWSPNQAEVSGFTNTYESRWLPIDHFEPENARELTRVLFDASRHASPSLHTNKGLAGVPDDVMAREQETSINPLVRDAAALIILSSRRAPRYPGVPGHEPDLAKSREIAAAISEAMTILRAATPGGGAYMNEADYFEPDWQQSFYGVHYERLLEIKQRYDATNLFKVHHGVGSEF
ncbi:MAG: FAD-binding protein [Rhodospirillaceae bacterium]|nr:FAD-binding protein [Rhodospirillaceae bacterium]